MITQALGKIRNTMDMKTNADGTCSVVAFASLSCLPVDLFADMQSDLNQAELMLDDVTAFIGTVHGSISDHISIPSGFLPTSHSQSCN